MLGAARHARQRLPRFGEFHLPLRIMLAEQFHRLGVMLAGHAERLGDRIGGDVVVGRADAAGGEEHSRSGHAGHSTASAMSSSSSATMRDPP